MNTRIFQLALACLCASGLNAHAGVLLFRDHFNSPDTTNFDGSDPAGRRSGLLGSSVAARSNGGQQQILNQQLRLTSPWNGVRFESDANGDVAGGYSGEAAQFNWASGTSGAEILLGKGFTVTFDWTPSNTTSDNWIAFTVGTENTGAGGKINAANSDFGQLFRNSGGTQYFDNGAGTTGGNFTVGSTPTTKKVRLQYGFDSFAAGSNVQASSFIDGVMINQATFQWDGTPSGLYFDLSNFVDINLVDNFSVFSGIPEPGKTMLSGFAALLLCARRKR